MRRHISQIKPEKGDICPKQITSPVNKNADSPEERKWSFVLSSMDGQSGDLYTSAAGTHLPVCTRQQQAAAGSSNVCCTIRFTICFIYILAHPLFGWRITHNRCQLAM